tara:strand:- start:296 stop:532 length:237 start_codon:yes stop_codon:yes gene_type:complete
VATKEFKDKRIRVRELLTGDKNGVALTTGNLLNRYVVTTEPWHRVHLLPLRKTLPKPQLPRFVISPGKDLRELFVIGF